MRWKGLHMQKDKRRRSSLVVAASILICLVSVELGAKDHGCLPHFYRSCLQDGRFRVRAYAYTADTADGGYERIAARVKEALMGDEATSFYFFAFDNPELLVKVVNACGVNGRYWVFGSAATDLDYYVTVTDLATGEERIYRRNRSNPLISDTNAFDCQYDD